MLRYYKAVRGDDSNRQNTHYWSFFIMTDVERTRGILFMLWLSAGFGLVALLDGARWYSISTSAISDLFAGLGFSNQAELFLHVLTLDIVFRATPILSPLEVFLPFTRRKKPYDPTLLFWLLVGGALMYFLSGPSQWVDSGYERFAEKSGLIISELWMIVTGTKAHDWLFGSSVFAGYFIYVVYFLTFELTLRILQIKSPLKIIFSFFSSSKPVPESEPKDLIESNSNERQ